MPDILLSYATNSTAVAAPEPVLTEEALVYSTSLWRLLDDLSYNKRCPVAYALRDGHTHANFGNYISYRAGLLTYTPKGKLAELEEHGREWKKKDRQEGKPAKVARALLMPSYVKAHLTDRDFETFANHVKATDPTNIGIVELVQGEAIRKWYHRDNNQEGTFTSCMAYPHCGGWFGLYEQNPNCFLLVVHRNGKNSGRALVWNTDKGMVLDRVYGSTAAMQVLRDHAAEQGWQTIGRDYGVPYTVQLEKTFFKAYPYLDTFQYVNHAKKTLTNIGRAGEYDQSLGYSNGGPHPNFTCRRCTNVFGEDELIVHDELGAFCHACAKKIVCKFCGKTARDMPDGGCRECVRIRTCECKRVDADPLTDQHSGPLCASCNAIGREGVAALRFERAETARIARERAEAARLAEEARYAAAQRRAAEERAMENQWRAEHHARCAVWNRLMDANGPGVNDRITIGPAILYETFHYTADDAVKRAIRERPATDYAHLSNADLRRLIENAQIIFDRARYDGEVPYGNRAYQSWITIRAWLEDEITRTKASNAKIKVVAIG